ncbi:HD domain-containing protein [Mycobacterium sp. 4858]|uniref:HD domain-containing protein n=1 Tax=Mycobacterium sp. 4858 TaxID=2057185 RepID=UPI000C81D6D8|nr:HD domain-containing protein [Mycobacterium sp. 4858]
MVHTPPVGSLEWERRGGPPLSVPQRLALLAGTGAVLLGDAAPRLRWALRRFPIAAPEVPRKIDLAQWAPPRTDAVRAAEERLRAVASPQIVNHSYRTYYFTAIRYELSGHPDPIDREALCVAALLHDVGLFDPGRRGCFTVAGARQAREIAAAAGWTGSRQDSVALAITTNLNPFVPAHRYGAIAHWLRVGGLVDVLAQQWALHPDNLDEILNRYSRDGFAEDTARLVKEEARRNPGCRFACFGPIFPTAVRWSTFTTAQDTIGR